VSGATEWIRCRCGGLTLAFVDRRDGALCGQCAEAAAVVVARSGYTHVDHGRRLVGCACPTCMEITVSNDMSKPELCSDCERAGCDGVGECRCAPEDHDDLRAARAAAGIHDFRKAPR
jgi:hypothetical protein